MDNKTRAFIYAFLSRVYEKELTSKEIEDLKSKPELLEMIGEQTKNFFLQTPTTVIQDELGVDYGSLFRINSQPIETLVVDSTGEILVGLQNPVMFFYFENGYELDMNKTEILAPDHIAIEFGFMQNLAYRDEGKVAQKFLKEHLLVWSVPYLSALKEYAQTPFYQDLADFTIDFLLSDYELLSLPTVAR